MKIKELLSEAPKVSEETKRVRDIIKSWREWIKANPQYAESSFGHYELTPNNELIHKGRSIILRDYMLDENGELPVKIHSCYKLLVATPKLKSFKNFPDKILADYRETRWNRNVGWILSFGGVHSNDERYDHITSLNGITPEIAGGADFSMLEKVNFSHVNTYIKSCSIIALPRDYVGPLLSFLKIPNLSKINCPIFANAKTPQQRAYAIVTKYLQGNKDIIACQRELIENDLDEYAEL